jgi:hypothetical protein
MQTAKFDMLSALNLMDDIWMSMAIGMYTQLDKKRTSSKARFCPKARERLA